MTMFYMWKLLRGNECFVDWIRTIIIVHHLYYMDYDTTVCCFSLYMCVCVSFSIVLSHFFVVIFFWIFFVIRQHILIFPLIFLYWSSLFLYLISNWFLFFWCDWLYYDVIVSPDLVLMFSFYSTSWRIRYQRMEYISSLRYFSAWNTSMRSFHFTCQEFLCVVGCDYNFDFSFLVIPPSLNSHFYYRHFPACF
jgi:hypothetical protein